MTEKNIQEIKVLKKGHIEKFTVDEFGLAEDSSSIVKYDLEVIHNVLCYRYSRTVCPILKTEGREIARIMELYGYSLFEIRDDNGIDFVICAKDDEIFFIPERELGIVICRECFIEKTKKGYSIYDGFMVHEVSGSVNKILDSLIKKRKEYFEKGYRCRIEYEGKYLY